ncbi:head-tail connector protein [Tardiphaga sp. 367_B4_N1_1]|uniref:head-tail connector protein n=1 Tax=Tardiphaga sp. 367_B4_N1_1 TaxID=3240777 RepID=UPI003F1F107D
MSIVVVTPPEEPVVSLEEAKEHLRVDHGDDDLYIESLVAAATSTIDGPDGWLGRCLVEQTLEWRGDGFGVCDIRLPYPPIIEILSVDYDDTDGVEQTVAEANYRLVGPPGLPRLSPAYGASWPSTRSQSEAVRIQYISGYGAADDVPQPIRHAVLMMVSELYENREASTDQPRTELPFAVAALLATYRVFA